MATITLTWTDTNSGEDGTSIERSLTGGGSGFSVIATVGANVETYDDDTVAEDTEYFYRVRAFKNTPNGVHFGPYSNEDSAEVVSAVAGAAFNFVVGTTVAWENVADPAEDGDRLYIMFDDGANDAVWTFGTGAPGTGPILRLSGGSLINGNPVIEMDASADPATSTPGDLNGQVSWSFSILARIVTPVADKGVLLNNADSPALQLYLDNGSSSVGFSDDGTDVDVAAAVSGVQVLIWVFDVAAGEVKVYRDTGGGLAQIGSTSNQIDGTGYEFFNGLCRLFSSPFFTNKPELDLAEFWGHPFAFSGAQLTQQAAYLASKAGF